MGTVAATQGTTLTNAEIQQLWIANGGDPLWAPTMAAVAYAESGGVTNNLNNNPATGDYSVGLWQINYFGGLLPGRTAKYGAPASLAADPNAQAKAAISLLGGGAGISNWAGDAPAKTVISGGGQPLSAASALAALQALKAPTSYTQDAAATSLTGSYSSGILQELGLPGSVGSAISGATSAASAVGSIGKLAGTLSSPGWWKRLGQGALGVALIITGIVLVASQTSQGKRITSEATQAGSDAATAAAVA
jgi:hypothetical protein